jgi:hypothetical protein
MFFSFPLETMVLRRRLVRLRDARIASGRLVAAAQYDHPGRSQWDSLHGARPRS